MVMELIGIAEKHKETRGPKSALAFEVILALALGIFGILLDFYLSLVMFSFNKNGDPRAGIQGSN